MLLMLLLAASTGFANDVAATTDANSTEKEAYYLFNSETKTPTCYFDTNKSARRGQVFDHFLSYNNSDEWEIIRNVNTVTFDESFKDYNGLTSTKEMFRGAVAFNEEQIEVEMANPNTGYFTEKNPRRAYALLSADKGTLTFYYDKQHDTRPTEGEVVYDVPWEGSEPGWCSFNSGFNLPTTPATFDPSFDDFHGLTSVNNMFAKLRYLRTVNGLEYLHTENVTDFAFMFYGCTSLKTLDLSCLNTSSATTMVSMFHGCNEMERLWLLGFDTRNVTNMDDMFGGCEKLKAIYCEDT